jgi:hypothetical protein
MIFHWKNVQCNSNSNKYYNSQIKLLCEPKIVVFCYISDFVS